MCSRGVYLAPDDDDLTPIGFTGIYLRVDSFVEDDACSVRSGRSGMLGL